MFEWLSRYFVNEIKDLVVSNVVTNLPGNNVYPDFKEQGKILSYVEQLPVLGKILQSLGDRREMLYKILLTSKPEDLRANLVSLPTDPNLPIDDPLSKLISGFAVHMLHSNMLHPPQTYLGNKFQYRSADGSDNSMLFPQLGKAGMPYAKSVPSLLAVHGSQPDPGDLFDLLLARDEAEDEQIRESNLGLSSMLLYHATVIIHDVFRTNNGDKNISDTSSYLDLSPLYGKDAEAQKTVRKYERGLLKPDSFAEERLLNQPVGVCIYLIMYNRFHNYVAQQLLEINENGKFYKPPANPPAEWKPNVNWQPPKNWSLPKDWQPRKDCKPDDWEELENEPAKQWSTYRKDIEDAARNGDKNAYRGMWTLWSRTAEEKLDEDLFQTARLITCGMFINISIHDYLRVLMRVHLKDTPWTLDPRKEIPVAAIDPRGIQRGRGNQVSVEFNVLYRFHSPLSRRDVEWTNDFLTKLVRPYVDAKQGPSLTKKQLADFDIPIPVMGAALARMYAMLPSPEDAKDPTKPTPAGLEPDFNYWPQRVFNFKRDPTTGKFDDLQLFKEMVKVMEDPICEFGAKNTAKLFRSIEILGIMQARKWELASLNEFRKFFNLPVHKNFKDINSDPNIANKLENLYRHPDQVELYPGLLCEGNGRCLDPGTACPNSDTALWGAVFCDAVTLVRSDRFYTTDWNVGSLTGWGMREVTSLPDVNKGSVMHRLFQRAFPGLFPYNSLHLWQPFHLPSLNFIAARMQNKLDDLEDASKLGLDRQAFGRFVGDVTAKTSGPLGKLKEAKQKEEELTSEQRKKEQELKEQGKPSKILSNQAIEQNVQELRNQLKSFIKPLKDLEENKSFGFTQTEVDQIAEAAKRYTADGFNLASIGLAFKPLKRVIKMPDSSFKPKKKAIDVKSYSTIVEQVLVRQDIYKNPGFLDEKSIPEGPLRQILTGKLDNNLKENARKALAKLGSMVTSEKEQLFSRYFEAAASDCLKSGSRSYQKQLIPAVGKEAQGQVSQVDIISDYAMPVVGRFVTDFLGFWDCDFEKDANKNVIKPSPDEVYRHLNSCQDYLTYNSDETTVLPRRIEFRNSINWLYTRAVDGVEKSGKRGTNKPKNINEELQQFGTAMAQELLKGPYKFTTKEVAAIRLSIALDAVHKSILMFAEVLDYLLHETAGKKYIWEDVQQLSSKNADADLRGYVLEAQRLAVKVPLVRQIPNDVPSPGKFPTADDGSSENSFQSGDVLLLHTYAAQQNKKIFEDPTSFKPNRDPSLYTLYQPQGESSFTAKHLTVLAVTALIKKAATLKELRRAHNMEGRLNKAKTPQGVERYLTQEFEQLVPFPTTWQLRYNGEGLGVFPSKGNDNSEVGHGMELIYQDGALSAEGGTHVTA